MKTILYEQNYKPLAQKLRRDMTKQEKHLWYDFLKKLPVSFRRQKQFGKYIVDFYCAKAKLVVEIDGSQHYEEEKIRQDEDRDSYLKQQGLRVLRFSNYEVNTQFESVCAAIAREAEIRIE